MATNEADDDIGKTSDMRSSERDHDVEMNQSWSNDPLIGRQLGDMSVTGHWSRWDGIGLRGLPCPSAKLVAIKVLASHLLDDPRAVERFRREMRTIGRINSPHIVQALDAPSGDVHYLVMEFVDGIDADTTSFDDCMAYPWKMPARSFDWWLSDCRTLICTILSIATSSPKISPSRPAEK